MRMSVKKDTPNQIEVNGNFTYTDPLTVNNPVYGKKGYFGADITNDATRKGVVSENFNYQSKNYTTLKIIEGTTNKMIMEHNHTDNITTLSMQGGQNKVKGLTKALINEPTAATSKE